MSSKHSHRNVKVEHTSLFSKFGRSCFTPKWRDWAAFREQPLDVAVFKTCSTCASAGRTEQYKE